MMDHNVELLELISNLSINSEDDLKRYCDKFYEIYRNKWRHSYSQLTRYFVELSSKNINVVELLTYTVEMLTSIFEKISEITDNLTEDNSEYKGYCFCRRNLEKLIDHLNLEIVRLNYATDLNKRVATLIARANKANKFIDSNAQVTQKLTADIKNQQTQSITILGIFASIVLSFTSGIGISSSIFSNMDKIDNPLLIFLTILIILFISNLLYYLFNFISKLNKSEIKQNSILWLNIPLFLVAFCCLYIQYH